MNDMYPSKYLAIADLNGKAIKMTIADVQYQSVADGEPDKPCLFFEKAKKGMILNKTNASMLCVLFGSDDTDDWIGKEIVLFNDPSISFQGKLTGGLRVKAPKGSAPEPVEDDLDDEIPF